jgi:cytochrome P450
MPLVLSEVMKDPSVRPDGLPPGPGLPSAAQTALLARDPLGVLLRCRAAHGPSFTLDLATVGTTVVVSDWEAAGPIVESAHAGSARRNVLPQASSHSSFGGEEESWRGARDRIAPPMLGGRLEGLRGEMAAIARRHVKAIPQRRPILMLSRMRALTQAIFTRLVLGVDDEQRADEIAERVGKVLRVPFNPPMTPQDRDESPLGRLVDAVLRHRIEPLEALLDAEVSNRDGVNGSRGILDHFADEADGAEVLDQLMVVLAAAQEPPSIAITSVLERLERDADLGARYDGADEAGREMIVDEILRLHPPAMASLRTLDSDLEVGRWTLPEGTSVMVPGLLVHRDPTLFERPEDLIADRFADGRPPWFIAFGGGPRTCPGEALARLELATVVPLVRERLQLEFPGRPERQVQRATVLVPNRGGLCTARLR